MIAMEPQSVPVGFFLCRFCIEDAARHGDIYRVIAKLGRRSLSKPLPVLYWLYYKVIQDTLRSLAADSPLTVVSWNCESLEDGVSGGYVWVAGGST